MLTLIRSPAPCLPFAAPAPPGPSGELIRQLKTCPTDFLWVVPTRRRLKFLERSWLAQTGEQACLTPSWQTLEGFVQEALSFSQAWQPSLGKAERLLLVAHSWEQTARRPAGLGLLRQLDRFQRDCQAVESSNIVEEPFRRFAHFYQQGLVRRGCLDRMAALRTLTNQLNDREPAVREMLERHAAVLFDGFHRFEPCELEFLAKLSHIVSVWIWLAGAPGQTSWRNVEFATNYLSRRIPSIRVVDVPAPATPSAALGRQLFPIEPAPNAAGGHALSPLPGLALVEAPTALAEVERVAAHIKKDVRQAESEGRPLRLAEIAIVVPGSLYDPLLREVLPRAGLPFNLAGHGFDLATSRPARLLLAALALIDGQWRADLLLDFLMQPIVRRRLSQANRLHALFRERPRQRRRLDFGIWTQSWQRHLRDWERRLALQERRPPDDEEGMSLEAGREALEQTARLIDSLEQALAPVKALEQSLAADAGSNGFLAACLKLLQAAGMEEWLTPEHDFAETDLALQAELHKDQQAHAHLLALWRNLAGLPASELPNLSDGSIDWQKVVHVALASETYQIRGDDDAGVQVFEIREIRGLRFKHVYALGLVDGQVPALPEEGALADLRRGDAQLAEQLQLKEAEAEWQFTQLFEAAQETLVLSRPCREAEVPVEPSAFLAAVARRVKLPVLEASTVLVDVRSAANHLGRLLAHEPQIASLESLWPGLEEPARSMLAPWAASAQVYRKSALERERKLDLPALLSVVLGDQRTFSPSELEKYAACPFRFFGSRLLRLEEREPDTTRLHYGSFVHRVLERVYIELRERASGLAADAPLRPVRSDFRRCFNEIFEAEWKELQDGLLPEELNTLFREQHGVADAFLQILDELEDVNELGNLCTEFEFKNLELGTDGNNRRVLISGIVDRIDLDSRNPLRAFVFDYKTGKSRPGPERQAKSVDGRLLQLALYGFAVGKRLNKDVVGAAYLYLNERRNSKELPISSRIGHEGDLKIRARTQPSPYDVERTRLKALELVNEIRAGNISLTEFMEGKYKECTNACSMRSACRREVVLSDQN